MKIFLLKRRYVNSILDPVSVYIASKNTSMGPQRNIHIILLFLNINFVTFSVFVLLQV